MEKPLEIVIVNWRLVSNVRILEQYPTSIREGQAAGMSTGIHGQRFLQTHDLLVGRPHFVTASYLRVFDVDLNQTEERKVPFKLTNWKTFYYRLRANFDGLRSEYVPEPPFRAPTDGQAIYDVGKKVIEVKHCDESGLTITFQDFGGHSSETLHPDLILAANGANSTIHKLIFPDLEAPYAGCLTWRGVVIENHLSDETRVFFHDHCIRYKVKKGYLVVYALHNLGPIV
ncbi:hypothetical protein HYALB_00011968 [Hymenoscyphus albidus]|uniref:2,6-dihydroxypyridine 3-monooxygenase substrate binding domain-containing protein n=1 Tax=Hymenoscyphus albidus TaxID=595503 RepID=A0A9N9LF94_9HELO|nr:hypothetical protein HYALB_00011968 [Hymenoscyphus albidus]